MQHFTSDNDLAKIYFESRQPKKKILKESDDKFGLGGMFRSMDPKHLQSKKPIGTSKSVVPYWKIYRLTRDAEPEATLIPGTEEQGFTEQSAMAEIAKRNKAPDQDGTSWWSCSPDPEFDSEGWNRKMLGESSDETNLNNPTEKEEVKLAKHILTFVENLRTILIKDKVARPIDLNSIPNKYGEPLLGIQACAQKLVKIHTPKQNK